MTTLSRAERLREVRRLNDRWVAENLASATEAFDASERPDGSDYNQHHVELDADGTAQDVFVSAAREILRGEGIGRPRHRAAELQRLAGKDVTPGHEQLHHYWTKGEGLAKWAKSAHPWTALYHHLVKHMNPEMAKRVASAWFHEVMGFWPGSPHVGAVKLPKGAHKPGRSAAIRLIVSTEIHHMAHEVDDDPIGELDDQTKALLQAMAELEAEDAERAWDPAKHPKGPDGKFITVVDRIKAALKKHIDEDGVGDPFEGFSREQLRNAAKARAIKLTRGEERESIAQKLIKDLSTPSAVERVPEDPGDITHPDGSVNVKRALADLGRPMPWFGNLEGLQDQLRGIEPGAGAPGARITPKAAAKDLRRIASHVERVVIPTQTKYPSKHFILPDGRNKAEVYGTRDVETMRMLADHIEHMKAPRLPASYLGKTRKGDKDWLGYDESTFIEGELWDVLQHGGVPLKKKDVSTEKRPFLSNDDQVDKPRPGLTEAENETLTAYTSGQVARAINTALRKQVKDKGKIRPDWGLMSVPKHMKELDLDEVQRNLDSAIAKGEIRQDAILWRGVLLKKGDRDRLKPGYVLTDHGYTSTATRRASAEQVVGFWQTHKKDLYVRAQPAYFKILAPKGTHGALGSGYVHEVILGRDQPLRVVRLEPGEAGAPPTYVMEAINVA